MSAECRKCGFDLDGDFGCPNCERQTLKFEYQTAKRQAAENGEAYSLCKQECDALKAENEQLRIQFKRADLFGLEAILESEQLFKRSCEKLKLERDALEAERDAYARAMAIALEHGIFPHKSEVKAAIDNVLKKARK